MLDSASKTHLHDHGQNRFAVVPTAERLRADVKLTGRGVRIAFLDSGFYPHSDFANRVVAFHDISGEEKHLGNHQAIEGHHWHGTQTVTACAGDGTLSNGIYRGLASEAELILVKVSRKGGIGDAEIVAGLEWLLANRDRLNLHIVNLSLGGDCDRSTSESRINSLIEELIADGIVVTVAAGNLAELRSVPPASAPSAITVGGYSEENRLAASDLDLYHSNHGETADGLIKPELIAPAMFVAAPILPATPDYESAEILSMLAAAPDYSLCSLLEEFWQQAQLNKDILNQNTDAARGLIEYALYRRKIVSTHYQHVDGTSFAAPITASVVAQMLQANPRLSPAAVKNILVSTASRLSGRPAIRQGFGILNARAAVDLAMQEEHKLPTAEFHPPRVVGRSIVFTFHDDRAKSVHLVGDFNAWRRDDVAFERAADGLWRASIPCQVPGKYLYKILIDQEHWTEDPSHARKEDDGYGGFNSILLTTASDGINQ